MTGVVLTVGNSLRGDDGAGPHLGELLDAAPAAGWCVIDGEATPENHTHEVRALAPDRLLLFDAAEMALAPGAVRRIDEAAIAEHFLMTTHAIPLVYLIASLRETIPEIIFLGIQPKQTVFGAPLSPEVRRAVAAVHQRLVQGDDLEEYQLIT